MKLVYVKWKAVKAFLASMDEPVSSEFQIIIRTVWQTPDYKMGLKGKGRWVYEVEIPVDMVVITR